MAKNVLISFKALDGVSLTADRAGPATNINYLDNISVHFQVGAGATGTFAIQVSNVLNSGGLTGNGPGSTDWVTIPLLDNAGASQSLAVSGSAVQVFAQIHDLAASYMRVIYTFTSGTGTATAWVTAKSLS